MFNQLNKGIESELLLLHSKAKFSLINAQINKIMIRKTKTLKKKKKQQESEKQIPSKKNEIFSALS